VSRHPRERALSPYASTRIALGIVLRRGGRSSVVTSNQVSGERGVSQPLQAISPALPPVNSAAVRRPIRSLILTRSDRVFDKNERPPVDGNDEREKAMRRLTAVLGSAAAVCAFSIPAASANSPAQHFVEDATGDVLDCGSAVYTITAGSIKIVVREGTSASGNTNFTSTVTTEHVVAVDEAGNVYSIRGTEWFGFKENAQHATFVATFTGQLQVIAQGSGRVDNVKVTEHITFVNGNVKEFDFGTCVAP